MLQPLVVPWTPDGKLSACRVAGTAGVRLLQQLLVHGELLPAHAEQCWAERWYEDTLLQAGKPQDYWRMLCLRPREATAHLWTALLRNPDRLICKMLSGLLDLLLDTWRSNSASSQPMPHCPCNIHQIKFLRPSDDIRCTSGTKCKVKSAAHQVRGPAASHCRPAEPLHCRQVEHRNKSLTMREDGSTGVT